MPVYGGFMLNKIGRKLSAIVAAFTIASVTSEYVPHINALPNNWAAGDYAYRFYQNYNSSYTFISQGDCANFGSQCLGEGKLDHKRVNNNRDDQKNWWYNFDNHSYSKSWASTTTLAKHLESRGCKKKDYYTLKSSSSKAGYNMLSNCSQGDIVICSNGTANPLFPTAEHTLVVGESYWIYNGPKRVVLYGHTSSAKYDVYLADGKITSITRNYQSQSLDYWNKLYYSYRIEKTSNLSN